MKLLSLFTFYVLINLCLGHPYKKPITLFSSSEMTIGQCRVQCASGCGRNEYDEYNCSESFAAFVVVVRCRCFDIPGIVQCTSRQINGERVCIH